ncbi:MAG TPA: ABC transporter ATP-binding protein [Anaeromyxobacteraceae bacterium]|nr:ABC transporter ATP-binding protein [Anaeromyxobacteraceae bacterium]
MSALLEVRGLARAFGGVHAVDRVSFFVEKGEVRGLIGPNGAGKTTVLNLVSGLIRPSAGSIVLEGRSIAALSPHRIAGLGVARTFQNIRLFPDLSALENVLVGEHLRRRPTLLSRLLLLPSAAAEDRRARAQAGFLLARVGLGGRSAIKARHLSYGEQRRVEIARALALDPRLLLLDEPTAGMNAVEAEEVASLVRRLAAEGHAVLLVEHNVRLVMDTCDAVTVLSFGQVIADGPPSAVAQDEGVVAAYLGRARP